MTRLTTLDLTPLHRHMVGFDRMFDEMDRLFENSPNNGSTGYPPYNIIKSNDYNYYIEIAVAGFNKDQIEVELSDGVLTVRSKIKDQKANETQNIIHQGFSQRNFVRKFTLSDEIRVKSADLNDGMLKIKLEKVIPEHKKPKLITIK